MNNGNIVAKIPIGKIDIGERVRKELGDIEGLARSMDELGLLHPIVISANYQLLAGSRRLAAARLLGWTEIAATIIETITVGGQ